MSTRCQVQVVDNSGQKITLYHHTDGYPSYMVPLFQKAFDFAVQKQKTKTGYEYSEAWKAERCGHAAAFLIAVDPFVFEPEEGHHLHGDIEYYYRIYVSAKEHSGSLGAIPKWEIEVFRPNRSFWDAPHENNLAIIHEKQPLEKLVVENNNA